ncbi:hypothetical protein WS9_014930 [Paraclostridium sordellii 8483]|uniref:hypothetical protein n=1 Tax=Paraclostridium sordellii TaxID=1505 RepID=UPI00031F2E05|nr:hypothetical protein [Paeniclostridium sordellii]TAN64080.1 hypothetical protein WS9_014930 [Paeniclostridium sordellii 8483]
MKDKNIEIEEIIKEHFKNLNICSFEYKGENEKGELVVEVSFNYKLIKDKLIEIEEIIHSEKK